MANTTSSASAATSRSAMRLDFLDALRGLAAAYVVVFHMILISNPNLDVPAWGHLVAFNGGTGVTLFFVISSFSLFYTMPAREKERWPWLSYALHRFFRIAPLFYLWIVLTIIRDHYVYQATHTWGMILASGSFLFNFIPMHQEGFVWASWTIGVEMLFYVVFPFVYLRTKNVWQAISFLLASMLVWWACDLVLSYLNISAQALASYRQWFFPKFLPEFAFGAIAFFIVQKALPWSHERPATASSVGMMMLLAAAFMYLSVLDGVGYFGLPDPRYAKALCCFLAVLALSVRPVGLLVNGLTRLMGKVSYSMYLNHPTLVFFLGPVYRWIYGHVGSMSVAFVASCVLTYAILIPLSVLTYNLIERPGMKLGKRCYAWLERRYAVIGPIVQQAH
ncbi:acyltransferase family protein [Dyella solisilvae]|nr:acyltransferase [Dyella solisilvae]